jgi:predicted RNase H-like HicB family nuclease
VNGLKDYQKEALKRATVTNLGTGEGYSAVISGFPGLIVFAETESDVLLELKSALTGWIQLSLSRGNGLPSLHSLQQDLVNVS